MYEIIVILKALTEIAGVAFLGQGVLWVIAGAKRDQNLVYRLFKTLTSPVTRVTRAITPRIVIDAHIGLVAFFLLMVIWLGLTVMKVKIFLDNAAMDS
jgi:sterol desaturase/sphingolipid hydroxylase (fatty acid hydroxylase superfamily)